MLARTLKAYINKDIVLAAMLINPSKNASKYYSIDTIRT